MKVSIIVPTYNRAHYIEDALLSIKKQTYSNIETVIVDDGSTDNTIDVVSKYVDERSVFFYKKKNGGCSSARNYGIKKATGDYFVFLDSDDLLLPDKIQKQLDLITETKTDYCVSDVFEFFYQPEWKILSKSIASLDASMKAYDIDHFMTFKTRNSAVMFGRKIFNQLCFREDLLYNEDSEFLQRVAIIFKGCYLPLPTVSVRNHSSNKSNQSNAVRKIFDSQIVSLTEIYKDFPEFALKLGEDRFAKRIQGIIKAELNKLQLQKRYDLIEEVKRNYTTEYDTSYYKLKLKDIKTRLSQSNSLFWWLYTRIKKEI